MKLTRKAYGKCRLKLNSTTNAQNALLSSYKQRSSFEAPLKQLWRPWSLRSR